MARRARRTFTPPFKAEVVLELLTGQKSAAELCRQHQLSPTLLTLWKQTYLERLPVVFQADEQRSQEQARVAELERIIGRQTVELEILKKAQGLRTGQTDAGGRSS
jgi:transposase